MERHETRQDMLSLEHARRYATKRSSPDAMPLAHLRTIRTSRDQIKLNTARGFAFSGGLRRVGHVAA